jgi:hypothetical protein
MPDARHGIRMEQRRGTSDAEALPTHRAGRQVPSNQAGRVTAACAPHRSPLNEGHPTAVPPIL